LFSACCGKKISWQVDKVERLTRWEKFNCVFEYIFKSVSLLPIQICNPDSYREQ